jgi:uncharacterized protein YbjT (DUF2867 family)
MDLDSMQAALAQASTLFLLNAVTPGELTQALLTLSLARDAGVKGIVYFSVFKCDVFTDVPHFTGKHAVERALEDCGLPATILRPNYFMQNDLWIKEALLQRGVYAWPIGSLGISMADARDIAEAAALCLLKHENSTGPLPQETIELVGPDSLTAHSVAQIWSEVLGREVRYGRDDLEVFERQAASFAPKWRAREWRLMLSRFQKQGMAAKPEAVARFSGLLGHPLRSYRDFAAETAKGWLG